MARMYSRKKGKSGSKRPMHRDVKWVKYKPEEVENLVIKYAKKGIQSAKIGILLRDQYGIPSVKDVTNKTISQIMKDNEAYSKYPEDFLNLLKRVVQIKSHLENNKRDYQSYRGLEHVESKIRRLAKYYKKEGILPQDWKYDAEQAKLLIR